MNSFSTSGRRSAAKLYVLRPEFRLSLNGFSASRLFCFAQGKALDRASTEHQAFLSSRLGSWPALARLKLSRLKPKRGDRILADRTMRWLGGVGITGHRR